MAANPKGYVHPELLVTPAELHERIAPGGPLVVDLRPAEQFAAGLIPGAVHLDIYGLSLIDTDPAPMRAFLWIVEHLFASRGVCATRPVVVYDEHSGMRAARAFWFLQLFGHPDVRLLDGGYNAWLRAGLPIAREAQAPVATEWHGVRRDEILADWRLVLDRVSQDSAALVDTRTDEEYYGENVRAARGGTIPGSVHLEWTHNLGPDGAYKSAADLRAMYAAAGITPDREIITYCQGGYRGAHAFLALRLIGYPNVRNYLGSWREWGDRHDLPIEQPRR
jgi:thiosulfate/3-mercaptopyruvate sulfurtransferase